ncbi:hypothetical protein [Embleya scabrispora]|uniref:hypothetical protein n=1 Tax=Embleya scabrispora TaxID=159449 RepID=UPI0003620353|nr:hypothetical protein [Embleya scabrispora]MYS82603.1 hypothetical protein [Streptomyces sp. SID5474]
MTHGAARRYDPAAEVLLGLAVASGDPGDAGRLRHRLGVTDPAYLADALLPIAARTKAVRDSDVLVRRAVARNPRATAADLAALLDRPDPVVDRLVYRHATALPWMRRKVLAPGRHPDPAALTVLLEEIRACAEDPPDHPHFVGAAVVSDVPALVEHALRASGSRLARAEQLRGVLGLFADPPRLAGLLAETATHTDPGRGRLGSPIEADGDGDGDGFGAPIAPDVADLAAHALASGRVADLRAAVFAAEGTAGLIAGLRAGEPEPTWRRDLDWARLLAAHRAEPLPEAACAALAGRTDCPDALLVELYRAHPETVARSARPSAALLEAAAHCPGHPEVARIAASAAAAGLTGERHTTLVVETIAPARAAIATLAELPAGRPLTDLIHRHLGGSASRWATVRVALSRHRGTLAELLAHVADGSVPDAGAAVPPALSRPYRFLLHAADPEDLRALLPRLPDELLRDLLGRGPLPAHALDVALATRDPRVCAAVAHNAGLDPRELGRLVALDEPSVDAAVYRNHRTPLTLRRTIASGVPRTPGRTEPVPLDPGLRADLLDCRDQRRLTPLAVSGDPELVHAALHAFPSADTRCFAFLRVWRRGGPDAVRRLVELLGEPGHCDRTAAVLNALEAPGGPSRLGPPRIPYEDPEALPRVFAAARGRNATRRLMATLVHEPYVYDLPRLVARHRETPYPPEPIDELLRHEHADGELGRLLRLALVNRTCGSGAEDLNREPVDRLGAVAFGRADAAWVNDCVDHGLLDPVRLVDTARPAGEVLRALPKLAPETVAAPIHARLAELVRTHLAGHVEATVIGLGLLDSFAGTVAELITVAAQAAGRPPGAAQRALHDAEIAEYARTLARHAPTSHTRAPAGPALPTRRGRRNTPDRGCALAAAQLLRQVVPDAPIPTDPAVLAVFAETPEADLPGLRHPNWLVAACAADAGDLPRERLARRDPAGFRNTASASVRYRAGLVGPAEMIATTPARALGTARPGELSQLARKPLTRAVRALLAARLGHDRDRWLAALAAMDTDAGELPLPALLDRVTTGADRRSEPAPATLSSAGSALLVYADMHVLRAVLPSLGPRAAGTLARDAKRTRHVGDDLVGYVLGLADAGPALILAEGDSRSPHTRHIRERLLDRGDPVLEDRLYGDVKGHGDVAERRRILARAAEDTRPLSPVLRERLLDPGVFSKYWADSLRVTVEAACPDVVELALAGLAGKLSLPDQLLAARNTLRFGGPNRLRALIDRGLLGSGAAGVAAKALAGGDPTGAGVAVLTSRIDRELSPTRLVARLRGCHRLADAERVLDRPYRRDWTLLASEHTREPWPAGVRQALVSRPDAPEEFVVTMPTDLRPAEAFAAARRGPRAARTVAAWVLPDGGTAEWHVEIERLIEAGLLTGHDLVHEVGHADRVLRYLADARARIDPSEPVRVAVAAAYTEVAALTVDLLGTEDRSWQRLFGALTERDAHWRRAEGPAAGVAALLAYAAREPLGRVFDPPPGAASGG